MSQSSEFVSRFLLEADIATKINHPHCVTVLEYAKTEDGQLYIVMEYLEGVSLDQRIQRGDMSLGEIITIGRQVASALIAAHRLRVVHRDLKPENIVALDREPIFVKVLDFGIAKNLDSDVDLTQAGQIFGTPEYMSPQQCQGQPVDQRSDLYSLGCILYEMIAGQPPFVGDTPVAVIMAHLTEEARDLPTHKYPEVKPSLVSLVRRLLAKEPEDRIESAEEVDRLLAEELRSLERSGTLNPMGGGPSVLVDGAPVSAGLSRRGPPLASGVASPESGALDSGHLRHRDEWDERSGQEPYPRVDPRAFLDTDPVDSFRKRDSPFPDSFSGHLEKSERMPSLDTLEGAKRPLPVETSQDETLVRHTFPSRPTTPLRESVDPQPNRPVVPWTSGSKNKIDSSSLRDLYTVASHPENRMWVVLIVVSVPFLFYLIVRLF
jgi:serine/threonine protein kinase